MTLTKDDYKNLLTILGGAEVRGLDQAKALAVLGAKLEERIAAWEAEDPSGLIEVARLKKDLAECRRQITFAEETEYNTREPV